MTGGRAADVVAPRPVGAGREHSSGHAARGAGCAVVRVRLRRAVLAGPPARPAAQRRGLPRRLLPTGSRSFRPSGAALRKQSWSGRPPPSLTVPDTRITVRGHGAFPRLSRGDGMVGSGGVGL